MYSYMVQNWFILDDVVDNVVNINTENFFMHYRIGRRRRIFASYLLVFRRATEMTSRPMLTIRSTTGKYDIVQLIDLLTSLVVHYSGDTELLCRRCCKPSVTIPDRCKTFRVSTSLAINCYTSLPCPRCKICCFCIGYAL